LLDDLALELSGFVFANLAALALGLSLFDLAKAGRGAVLLALCLLRHLLDYPGGEAHWSRWQK
jgi:hypothetical protein